MVTLPLFFSNCIHRRLVNTNDIRRGMNVPPFVKDDECPPGLVA